MFAIIETGGKQVKVEEGQTIFVEKIEGDINSVIGLPVRTIYSRLRDLNF